MKLVFAGVLTILVIIALFIPKLKSLRGCILIGYGVCVFLLSAFQTYRTAPIMLPFYHAKEQIFYQSDFASEGLYPDALLQLLVKGKTVYTKDDMDDYLREHKKKTNTDYFDDDRYWIFEYYHQTNTTQFLNAAGANVVAEDCYNKAVINEDMLRDDFEELGYVNDMYRYLFPLSQLNDEWSNSFFYYWYYGPHLCEKKGYINPVGIAEADEIVVLWEDDETLYVMTKEYYDREVAPNV